VTHKSPLRVSYCAFVAAVVALLVYLRALGNGFAYDDAAIILRDARIHSLGYVGMIFRTGYWADASYALYRPFTTLSFAIDWSLAPGSGAWFHLTNALGHSVASALAVLLLARFFTPAAALLGGLVFASHPVHVEAVANVVGRADVFAAVFSLGACAIWSLETTVQRWRILRVAAVAALYTSALLTKESAVMLPALLLLTDVARGALKPGETVDYLRRNADAFAVFLLVFTGWMALRLAVLGSWAPTRLDPTLDVATTPLARTLTALQAWPVYLQLLAYPATLLADYGPRILMPVDRFTLEVVEGALLLAACLVGGLAAYARGHGRTALALLWFPFAMLPVSNLIIPIGVLVAERTLYLASFAICVGLAGVAAWAIRFAKRPIMRGALLTAAGAALVLLTSRTVLRVPEWESTERIMGALLRDRPDAFRGQWHFARLAAANGDTAQALARYDAALRLWPYRQSMTIEAAGLAAASGRTRMAYDIASFAARKWPDDIGAQRLLAGAALDLADTVTARRAMRKGLKLDPHDDLLRRMSTFIADSTFDER
jgi:hypothetical protein